MVFYLILKIKTTNLGVGLYCSPASCLEVEVVMGLRQESESAILKWALLPHDWCIVRGEEDVDEKTQVAIK